MRTYSRHPGKIEGVARRPQEQIDEERETNAQANRLLTLRQDTIRSQKQATTVAAPNIQRTSGASLN